MRNALSLAGAALVVAACAAVPRTTHELESARSAYRTAAASPEVQARAPFELQAAERALGDAERFQQVRRRPGEGGAFFLSCRAAFPHRHEDRGHARRRGEDRDGGRAA